MTATLKTALAELMQDGKVASLLRQEAERLAALDSPSATIASDVGTSRTAAMIMAEAAASLVAQANYSRDSVRDLLGSFPAERSDRAD